MLMSVVILIACGPDQTADRRQHREDDSASNGPDDASYTTAFRFEMVQISAGTFTMGDAAQGSNHEVTLTHDFWMGMTEVTQQSFNIGIGANPSDFSGSMLPVEQVSWHYAAMYANALSIAEGLEPCFTERGEHLIDELANNPYACMGYRLPTNAEWEYAARAGEDFIYAGSDSVREVAWIDENSGGTPHDVATRAANSWGLHDMSGNVYEWVHDAYESSTTEPAIDPASPENGRNAYVAGGSWAIDASRATVTSRSHVDTDYYDSRVGFRLVRTAEP